MNLSREVVEKICGMDHLSGKERTSKLDACENVAFEVARIRGLISEAEEVHKERMKILAKDLQDARNMCRHEFTKYHPDASGNNDSFSECQVCGAEVPNKKSSSPYRPCISDG